MDTEQEEVFQIATLIVVVGTAIVCMCYFLIFLNPQIALNPLKPPLATPTLVAGLPATWTPTATGTPSQTPTPSMTPTVTDTPIPTPIPSRTRIPTRRPTSTPVPIIPTLVAYTYPYRPVNQRCSHSGGTFIKGTVWYGGVPQSGVRIRLSWTPNGPAAVTDQVTGYQLADQSTSYTFVLRGNGAYSAGSDWYVWVLDYGDQPASDPNAAHVRTNNFGPNDGNACWLAIVDFAR